MTTTLTPSQLQEFYDLLALSALNNDIKFNLLNSIDDGTLDEQTFTQIVSILREEDRLEKDIQKYGDELANFDTDDYLNKIQIVVDEQIKHYLSQKQPAR